MSRLPAVVLAVLAVATTGAFFFVQHLKVTTPLIGPNASAPNPAVINPHGVVCGGVDHRSTYVTFYLLHRSDSVDVYVVNQSGEIVATLASGHYMPGGSHAVRERFDWHGYEYGHRVAPDGTYYIQVDLIHQGRSVMLSAGNGTPPFSIRVESHAPQPVVRSVTPQLVPQGSRGSVKILYSGTEGHLGTVRIYRTDLPGGPRQVVSFLTPGSGQTAVWDGRVAGHPAPAGVYLAGLEVTDAACNTGRFPTRVPPEPGSTTHAGFTVRYVAAQPPLNPIPAGSRALVYVDARQRAYAWALRRFGSGRVLAHGSGRSYTLRVRVPRGPAGLYTLTLRAGAHATSVPLLVAAPRPARVLVVLPALTWQGSNPADDDGDGLPNTLSAGLPVLLARPFGAGLPSGLAEENALLQYLSASRLPFAVTTDLALDYGIGPRLAGHPGVILAGDVRWVSREEAGSLRAYVRAGGHILSLGRSSLRAYVRLQGGQAADPTPVTAVDVFGLRHGSYVTGDQGILTATTDALGLFSHSSGIFTGYSAYDPVIGAVAPARLVSTAGTRASSYPIAGAQLGRGTVVEVGLSGFATRLGRDLGSGELFSGLWAQLTG